MMIRLGSDRFDIHFIRISCSNRTWSIDQLVRSLYLVCSSFFFSLHTFHKMTSILFLAIICIILTLRISNGCNAKSKPLERCYAVFIERDFFMVEDLFQLDDRAFDEQRFRLSDTDLDQLCRSVPNWIIRFNWLMIGGCTDCFWSFCQQQLQSNARLLRWPFRFLSHLSVSRTFASSDRYIACSGSAIVCSRIRCFARYVFPLWSASKLFLIHHLIH